MQTSEDEGALSDPSKPFSLPASVTINPFSKSWDPGTSLCYKDGSNRLNHPAATDFFYKPLTLTVFGVLSGGVALLAFGTEHLAVAPSIKARAGVLSGLASFLIYSMLQGRDGPFKRPHPVRCETWLVLEISLTGYRQQAFWRLVLGTNFIYFAFLSVLHVS